jgi:prolyl-tRNA editing enzyme YbaK/EbsC (Cys-tRNA(Pro) deacylase)
MCGAELHVLPQRVQRVARALQDAHHPHGPVMLGGAARTAQEAADGLGVQLGQIAKSVIFKRKEDGVAVLVQASPADLVLGSSHDTAHSSSAQAPKPKEAP